MKAGKIKKDFVYLNDGETKMFDLWNEHIFKNPCLSHYLIHFFHELKFIKILKKNVCFLFKLSLEILFMEIIIND